MKHILGLLLICSHLVFAQEINVELNPNKPVAGDSFTLSFRVQTVGNEQPYISFSPPSTIEVLGKSNEGVSISSVIIGGKVTMQREVLVVYELRAENPGMYRIKDIKVEKAGKTQKLADVTVSVLKEKEKPKDIFYLAVPSKNKVFLGEGLDVSYFSYARIRGVQNETTDYPKLAHFIKRFHDVKSPPEIVEYNGERYSRLLIYQARLYPQKVGKAVLDPLRAIARYQDMMGFGQIAVREKNVYSPPVDIEVMALPTANMPKDFTGLVGEHDFKFTINKEKFLTNEVIEAKLIVQGPGALESYEGPKIFQDSKLEDFEVKSDLQEVNQSIARKVFDYTYLTRSGGQIPSHKISFSYFDPHSVSYKTKTVDIPAISISGVAAPSNGAASLASSSDKNDAPKPDVKADAPKKGGILAPVFSEKELSQKFFFKNNWINLFNGLLGIVLLIVAAIFFFKREKKIHEDSLASNLSDEIKNKGINYARLHKLVALIRPLGTEEDDVTLNKILDDSSLSIAAKTYFKGLVELCEHMGYNAEGKGLEYKYEKQYFKELIRAVAKRKS